MAGIFIDTGGSATNSGSSDNNTADLSGTAATSAAAVVSLLTDNPDLSAVDATAGSATQAFIYLNDASNANHKAFRIIGKDNTAGVKTVTVDVAPTGIVSSAWAIGGRYAAPAGNGLNLIEGAFLAGDIITVNNSPASASVDWLTTRVGGDSTSGFVTLKGKAGTRPVITVTNTTQCLEFGAFSYWWVQNLELVQQGASGATVGNNSTEKLSVFYNVKISDGGGIGLQVNGSGGDRIIASEISGVGANGISGSLSSSILVNGCYVHDLTGVGFALGSAINATITRNIFDTTSLQGIALSGAYGTAQASIVAIDGNTVYGCGNSGLEIADQDANVVLTNNIFSENGDAAGEYNVEWVAGTAERVSFHAWNVFFHSGGGGGANLSNLTVNAQVASSEFTTDPLFTNAAGGDFSIGSTSPAKATGYPGAFLGGSTGYLDIGAVQIQAAAGGGGQRVIGS